MSVFLWNLSLDCARQRVGAFLFNGRFFRFTNARFVLDLFTEFGRLVANRFLLFFQGKVWSMQKPAFPPFSTVSQGIALGFRWSGTWGDMDLGHDAWGLGILPPDPHFFTI